MAYGKRLYLTFKDLKDTAWTIEIYQDGYSGTAYQIVMSGDPVSVRWGGDKWKNIISSECTISLRHTELTDGLLVVGNQYKIEDFNAGDDFTNVGGSNASGVIFTATGTTPTTWTNSSILTSNDFSWLNTSNGLEVKVIIKKAGNDWWQGFVLPDQYFDTLNYTKVFTLTASDRIGKLRDFEYSDASTGFPYDGYRNALDTLARTLSKTGLELDLRSAVNLFEDGMTEADTDDPLDQVSLWQDVFQSTELDAGNCYDVVNVILKTFQARLFQSDNEWWIVRIPEYNGASLDYRGYTFDSVDLEYDYSFNNTFSPEKATGANFKLLKGGRIETVEPWEQLTVKKDYGKKDTIIKGSTFPKNEFDGTDPRHFTISGTSGFEQKIVGDTYGLKCETVAVFDAAKNIVSEGVAVELTTTEKFEFKLIGGWFAETAYAYFKIYLDSGTDYWYDGNSWETSSQIIATRTNNFISPIPVITTYSDSGEATMEIDGFPADGTLYIYIYDPTPATVAQSLYIKSLSIVHIDTGERYPDTEDEITVIDTENEVLAEYGMSLTDEANEFPNNQAIYGGVLRVGSLSAKEWHVKGTPGTVKTLSEWIGAFTVADAAAPLQRFTGRIYGQSDYFNTIELTEHGAELFAWDDVEYNIKKAIWNGSATNIKGALVDASGTSTGARTAANVTNAATYVTINNITQGDTIPLTTDGDIMYFDTAPTRLGIGSTSQILSVVAGFPAWVDATAASQLNNNEWFLAKDHNDNDQNVFKVTAWDTLVFGLPVELSELYILPDSGLMTLANMGITSGSSYGTEVGFQFMIGGNSLKYSGTADGAGGMATTPTLSINGISVGVDYSGLTDNTIPFYDSGSGNIVDSALTDDGTDVKSSEPVTLEYDANLTELILHNTGTGGRNISLYTGKTATPTYGANFVIYDNDAATHLLILDASGVNIPTGDKYRIAGANIITASASFDDTNDTLGASMKGVKDYGDANWAGGGGTVTSVAMSVPTGLTVAGSPITGAGTLAVTLTAGYSIPTTANQTLWTTAYNRSIDTNPSFNTADGVITFTQQDAGTLTVDIDGRYVNPDVADTFTAGMTFNDSVALYFGTGSDCLLYHNDTDFVIDNNKGEIKLGGSDVRLNDGDKFIFGSTKTNSIEGDSTPELVFKLDGTVEMTLGQSGLHSSGYLKSTSYIESGSFVDIAEISTPATPASGWGRLYFTSGSLFYKNDAGTALEVATVTP